MTTKRSRPLTPNLSLFLSVSLHLFTQSLTCVSLTAKLVLLQFHCFIVADWKPGWNRVARLYIKEETPLLLQKQGLTTMAPSWVLDALDLDIYDL